ncbi:DMT family transporter [Bifidobacterium samirii]|uniref:Putative inner membrane exporter, YdcZ n=1 Tax=Bifidobacterium samirii TaxID=2306974 RepID=A0A430FNT6_9BIFI|nr:DMT family transporter [Bifidobacterium samirii]RSX54500.1 putative inner membrane exporter, YdcZ [Bifidobacterium samirii]
MWLVLLGLCGGALTPTQTAVNTRLRKAVGSPFRASLVSFTVGTIALIAVTLLIGPYPLVPAAAWNEPWWVWLPGLFGVVFLTGNVLLMPHLGSLQTVMMPVLGQIAAGLCIDAFGLLGVQRRPFTVFRGIGALLALAGFIVTIALANRIGTAHAGRERVPGSTRPGTAAEGAPAREKSGTAGASLWLWRAFGVCTGMCSAVQTAILGRLGTALGSPIKASLVSFMVGMLALAVVVGVAERSYDITPALRRNNPVWMWAGGLLGGVVVLTNSLLSSHLGTGLTVVIVLAGQVLGSVVIDHFGLLETPRKPVRILHVVGLAVAFAGIALIRLT